MIVYHTGFETIKCPDISYGRRNADFGQGFYLSSDEAFSCRWARAQKGRETVINTYELDLDGLSVHRFTRDIDWFSYIFRNRRGQADRLTADVVIGPIANDTIYDTMGIITSGFLKDEQALSLLRLGPEYRQIVLKTKKAAQNLSWISSRVIEPSEIAGYRSVVSGEETAYLNAVSKAMDEF